MNAQDKLATGGRPFTQANLPGAYRAWGRRAHLLKLAKIPAWYRDEAVRERVQRVHQLYLDRVTIPEIMAREEICYDTVAKDIWRATEERRIRFALELENAVVEAVSVRQRDIRALGQLIDRLESAPALTASQVTALATLYDAVERQRTRIEELLSLRGQRAGGPPAGGEAAAQPPVTLVINMDSVEQAITDQSEPACSELVEE